MTEKTTDEPEKPFEENQTVFGVNLTKDEADYVEIIRKQLSMGYFEKEVTIQRLVVNKGTIEVSYKTPEAHTRVFTSDVRNRGSLTLFVFTNMVGVEISPSQDSGLIHFIIQRCNVRPVKTLLDTEE